MDQQKRTDDTDKKMNDMHEELIIPGEVGILRTKEGGFHSPSSFALDNLFYILWGNEYTCRAPYRVDREGLQYYMAFRVITGSLYFEYVDKLFAAKPGDVVLLDGREKHVYYAKEPVTFQHFIFRGNCSDAFYKKIHDEIGVLHHNKSETMFLFNYIQSELEQTMPDDYKLSLLVHNILSVLVIRSKKKMTPVITKAQQYILDHYDKDLSVDDIADEVSLSKYHFSRLFKEETGYSPHEFLYSVRLRNAKKMLSETKQSVNSIAAACGFSNTSHFIRAFKKETLVTPASFRKYFDPSGFK